MTIYIHSGKSNVTVWRPSVCPSVCPVGIYSHDSLGGSVHFGPTMKKSCILVRLVSAPSHNDTALFCCNVDLHQPIFGRNVTENYDDETLRFVLCICWQNNIQHSREEAQFSAFYFQHFCEKLSKSFDVHRNYSKP